MGAAKKKLINALVKVVRAADKHPNKTIAASGAAGLGTGYAVGWKKKGDKEKASELRKYSGGE